LWDCAATYNDETDTKNNPMAIAMSNHLWPLR
jgi:hypothetical protein